MPNSPILRAIRAFAQLRIPQVTKKTTPTSRQSTVRAEKTPPVIKTENVGILEAENSIERDDDTHVQIDITEEKTSHASETPP
jgi:hypothetical protein